MPEYATAVDPAAFTNAFNAQVNQARQQRQQQFANQLAVQQNQRAQQQSDQSAQEFQVQQNQQKLQTQQDLNQRLAAASQNILKLPPQTRKAAIGQMFDNLAPEFQLAGVDVNAQKQKIQGMTDDQLEADLQAHAVQGPKVAPVTVAPGASLVDPTTGHPVYTAPAGVDYKDAGDKLVPTDKVTGQVRTDIPTIPKKMTAFQQQSLPPAADTKAAQLDSLLASAGINNPNLKAGSKGYTQRLNNIIAQNPDKSPQDIVDGMRNGVLDFNGAKRSTGQLATVAAATNAASLQLEKNFQMLDPLVQKMGTTSIPIIDRAFAQLRANWSSNGDADTSKALALLRASATEYAKIISGGTGAAAPSVEDQKEAMKIMQGAFSTGGYQGIRDALMQEASNKRESYSQALRAASAPGAATGGAAPAAPAGKPTVTNW